MDGCREVVTLNQSMHRSFTPPLTGLLNFPIIEHFKDSEIWGHGSSDDDAEAAGDLSKLVALLVRTHTHTHRFGVERTFYVSMCGSADAD